MNSETVGYVKKCPNCNAVVEPFQTKCSYCGAEISGVKVADSLQSFIEQISKWDDEEFNKKTEVELAKINTIVWILLWVYIFPGLFVLFYRAVKRKTGNGTPAVVAIVGLFISYIGLLISLDCDSPVPGIIIFVVAIVGVLLAFLLSNPVLTSVDKRKEQFIENFPVPNSKEDFLEFTTFCTSHIRKQSFFSKHFTQKGKKQEHWNVIWENKCKQLYMKSRLSIRDDPATLALVKEFITEAGIKL